jgi:hypothetical protein
LKKILAIGSLLLALFANATILEGDTLEVCSLSFPIVLHANKGNQQYLWSTGSIADSTTIQTSGKYWVQIKNNGMVMSDTIFVVSKTATFETFSVEQKYFCLSDTPWTVSSSRIFDNEGWWNNGQIFFLQTSTPGKFWFTSIDKNFCLQQIDSIEIVGLSNSSTLTFSTQQSICTTAFPAFVNVRYGDNPIWNTGSSDYDLLIDTPGTYSYQSTIGNCAQVFDTIVVVAKTITPPTLCCDTTFCFPDSATFQLPTGFVDYYWSTGQNAPSIAIGKIGVFNVNVTVTDNTNCTAKTNTIVVEVKDSVPQPTIVENGNFLVAQPNGYSYQWFKNDSLIANANSTVLSFNRSGKYCVIMSNGYCSDSACITFSIPSAIAITNNTLAKFFPNPAQELITLESTQEIQSCVVTNTLGNIQKLNIQQLSSNKLLIETTPLANGIYFLNLKCADYIFTEKFMVKHE